MDEFREDMGLVAVDGESVVPMDLSATNRKVIE